MTKTNSNDAVVSHGSQLTRESELSLTEAGCVGVDVDDVAEDVTEDESVDDSEDVMNAVVAVVAESCVVDGFEESELVTAAAENVATTAELLAAAAAEVCGDDESPSVVVNWLESVDVAAAGLLAKI